ncbi:hypothetical protein V8C34DRAFT_14471 [Trichoderma compactum]
MKKPAQLPLHLQLLHLRNVLSMNPTLVLVLTRAASLDLPNWYLAAGAPSQTIWNNVSSLPPETGIHDYHLVYHDASDLSYEAEDVVIQAGKRLFADIPVEVEIRNQARVHSWYEKKFGLARPANQSVEDGIDSSTVPMSASYFTGYQTPTSVEAIISRNAIRRKTHKSQHPQIHIKPIQSQPKPPPKSLTPIHTKHRSSRPPRIVRLMYE